MKPPDRLAEQSDLQTQRSREGLKRDAMHTQQYSPRLVGHLVLILAMLPALMSTPAMAQSRDEAATLRSYHSGNGLLNRGMYDLAVREYRAFLREHADHEKAPTARYGLGVCLYRLKDHRGAIEQLRIVHDADGFAFAADVAMLLGRSHLAVGEPAEAAEYFGSLLANHRTHQLADDAAALQVEALYQADSYEQLEQPARTYLRRWPTGEHRERVELFWGLADFAREEFAAAAERFASMREQFADGRYADQTTMLLAKSLHRDRRLQEAAESYDEVLETNNELYVPEALYGLAAIRQHDRDLRAAENLLERFLEQYEGHNLGASARLLAGRVAFDRTEYEAAQQHFTALSKIANVVQADDAAYWLAKCDLRLKKADRAEQKLVTALNTFVESDLRGEMLHDLGVARLRTGKPGLAVEALQQFVTQMENHTLAADVLYLLAAAEHEQGDYQASATWCDRFTRAHEGHHLGAAVAFLDAENAFLQDDLANAEAAYRAFLDVHPDDERADDARYRLGLALHQQQRYAEARGLLDEATRSRDANRRVSSLLALADGYFQLDAWSDAADAFAKFIEAAGSEHENLPEALLKRGLALHRQDQHARALATYDRFLALFGDKHDLAVQVMFERGQTLVAMEEPARAKEMFERVLRAGDDPRFAIHVRNHLAAIAMQDEDYDAAARYAAQVAERADGPAVAEAMYRQARAELSAKRYGNAAKLFARVVQDHDDAKRIAQAAAYEVIAIARDGDHAAALALVDQVERRHLPQLDDRLRASVLYEKAWCHRNAQEPQVAAQTYERIIAIKDPGPIALNARVELADLRIDNERYTEAVALLTHVQQAIEDMREANRAIDEVSLYGLGLCHLRLNQFDDAAAVFEAMIDRHPESGRISSARLLCAQAMYEAGSVQLAIAQLTRIIEDHKETDSYGPALLRQGEYLAVLQHWRRSEEAFVKYLEECPESELWFQARFGIGWARENAGDHPAAIAAYQQVIARHDGATAARAQFQIGECYFAMNEPETAIAELMKVDILYAYPQWSAAALYEAGRCFEKLGKVVEARNQYRAVVDRFASSQWAELAQGRLEHLAAIAGRGG